MGDKPTTRREALLGAFGLGVAATGCGRTRLEAVAVAGGGTVFLPPGTYLVNHRNTDVRPPILLRGGVSLVGAGRGATVVKLGEGAVEPSGPRGALAVIANFANPTFNESASENAP